MTMQKIKRVVIGNFVQADVTGTGEWLIGRITKSDKAHIWFDPADGSEEIKILRQIAYKATEAEFLAAAKNSNKSALVESSDKNEEDHKPGVHLTPDMSRYVIGLGSTISGRDTVDINDMVSAALRGLDIEEVYERTTFWLKKMGIKSIGSGKNTTPVTTLRTRYEHLNLGMQRMTLGNIVRANAEKLGLKKLP